MNDIAIRIQKLGKQYRIGGRQFANRTFREALIDYFYTPLRWLKGERVQAETFWALEDVSVDITRGQAVGIIGRNGAGKSTLLKVLSRITKPTRGRINLYGRVVSLLEVGTGFHPELSGRDNIYLNGAILGMTRMEITRKFDEIVDFAEIEKFLDTPVKHYSSGMYVRLAFAVAAHLEPEILLIDEVLAVGDAEFQRKCLGKMEDVSHKEGRTVLFVSHNMNAIQRLVDRCIWIDRGRVALDGDPHNVINSYLESGSEQNGALSFRNDEKFAAQIVQVMVLDQDGNVNPTIVQSQDLILEIDFVIRDPKFGKFDVVSIVSLIDGTGIFCFELANQTGVGVKWSKGNYRLRLRYPTNVLSSGKYIARASIALGHKAYHNHPNTGDGVYFEIINKNKPGDYRKRYSSDISVLSIEPVYDLIEKKIVV